MKSWAIPIVLSVSCAQSSACRQSAPTGQTAAIDSAPSLPEATTKQTSAPSNGANWLHGDSATRFGMVAKHLRGFDVAMMETGYRYTELYWAGRDRNWGYASYQLEKIETAIANGVERRPKRAESARMLASGVVSVRAAVEAKDSAAFDSAFTTLTTLCNACHRAEQVPFVTVTVPTVRLSPVRFESPPPTPSRDRP